MNKQEKTVDNLIIESPTLVSKTRRFTEWTLHIMGWILWILLIRPLIIVTLWYAALYFFNYHMFKLEGIDNPEYFGIGAAVLATIYLGMFGWSRYNAWRFRGKDKRKSSGVATPEKMAEYYKVKPENITCLQDSKNVDVYFPGNDIIEIDSEKVSKLKALYAPQNQEKHHDRNIVI
ncbi:MAG: poly-beta-1,6-N-acetyl-D-glucosamine biosynthesis protein PgaD [Victivallales bacterium]